MQDKNIMNLIGLQHINVLNVENLDQVKYIYIELFKVIPVCPKSTVVNHTFTTTTSKK